MSSLLDRIIEDRRRRQPLTMERGMLERMLQDCLGLPAVRSLHRALETRPAVIAEIKRCSPSAGELAGYREPAELATAYEQHGAVAISLLTNESFFGMQKPELTRVAQAVGIPVLRKEFIISEYDVLETRLLGADAVLLIVRLLNDAELATLYGLARQIGLEVLLEVHSAAELDRALRLQPEIIGINARNLDSLQMDLAACLELAGRVPAGIRVIAESGIRGRSDLDSYLRAGISRFLIGTELLRHERPEKRLAQLLLAEDGNE